MKTLWGEMLKKSSTPKRKEVFIGTLTPIMWDKNGNISKYSIYSFDEEDIIIEGFKDKEELKRLINSKVVARGEVSINEYGEKKIKVTSLNKLTEPTSKKLSSTPPSSMNMWNEEFSISIPINYTLSHYKNLKNIYWEAS